MIRTFNSPQQLSKAAAELFIQTAKEAIQTSGRFTVALTGGSSPKQLYRLLATAPYRDEVEWAKVLIFWGDERWVPVEDERSNARMAFDTLLRQVQVPKENIHVMWHGNRKPEDFAREYEQWLRFHMGSRLSFDLILLGMGEDGHTASLFPGTEVLKEQTEWVRAYYLAPQEMYRVTLTAPLINLAKHVVFIVFGSSKAPALREVLEGEKCPERYPAQLIQPQHGRITWLLDEAAAAELSARTKNTG